MAKLSTGPQGVALRPVPKEDAIRLLDELAEKALQAFAAASRAHYEAVMSGDDQAWLRYQSLRADENRARGEYEGARAMARLVWHNVPHQINWGR